MKMLSFALAAVVGLSVSTRADAAMTLGLSSVEEATIQFAGTGSQATVTFNNGLTGNSFGIQTVDGSPGGSPSGLFGTITGSFTYLAAGIVSFGPVQGVVLNGSGVLRIGPAGGPALTADIAGIDIFSLGKVGGINGLNNVINLSNIAYSGSNVALVQLQNEATAGGGSLSISYQFGSSLNLAALAAAGATRTTTYSGTVSTTEPSPVTTVPEPGSMGMAFTGVALVGLGYYRQRRRKLA